MAARAIAWRDCNSEVSITLDTCVSSWEERGGVRGRYRSGPEAAVRDVGDCFEATASAQVSMPRLR
jgi:hypothetical protein